MTVSKNLLTRFYKRLSNTSSASYYSSTHDIPIANFVRCMSGDLSKVSKTEAFDEAEAAKAWAQIFDEHLKDHGLPENYTRYLTEMQKASEFFRQAYCEGKRWQLVRARVKEAEAQSLLSGEGEKIEIICARISKHMGFPVRATECSAADFYNYMAIMGSS